MEGMGPINGSPRCQRAKNRRIFKQAEKIIADQELSAQENEKILKEAKKEANNIILEAKDAGEKLKQKARI